MWPWPVQSPKATESHYHSNIRTPQFGDCAATVSLRFATPRTRNFLRIRVDIRRASLKVTNSHSSKSYEKNPRNIPDILLDWSGCNCFWCRRLAATEYKCRRPYPQPGRRHYECDVPTHS